MSTKRPDTSEKTESNTKANKFHKTFKGIDIKTIVSSINSLFIIEKNNSEIKKSDDSDNEPNGEGNQTNNHQIIVDKNTDVLDLFNQILKNKEEILQGLLSELSTLNDINNMSYGDFVGYLIVFLRTREEISEKEITKLQHSHTKSKVNKIRKYFLSKCENILSPDNREKIGDEIIATIEGKVENKEQSTIILNYLNKYPEQKYKIAQLICKCGITKITSLINISNIVRLINEVNYTSDLVRLINEVNYISDLIRLINEIDNISDLVRLINEIDNISDLVSLINEINDINKIIKLIDKNIDKLVEKINKHSKDRLVKNINKGTLPWF